jgi:hypothetical protein
MNSTLALAVALIGALGSSLAVVVSHVLAGKKIEQVHVLVNSRLDAALRQIELLEDAVVDRDATIEQQQRS